MLTTVALLRYSFRWCCRDTILSELTTSTTSDGYGAFVSGLIGVIEISGRLFSEGFDTPIKVSNSKRVKYTRFSVILYHTSRKLANYLIGDLSNY